MTGGGDVSGAGDLLQTPDGREEMAALMVQVLDAGLQTRGVLKGIALRRVHAGSGCGRQGRILGKSMNVVKRGRDRTDSQPGRLAVAFVFCWVNETKEES